MSINPQKMRRSGSGRLELRERPHYKTAGPGHLPALAVGLRWRGLRHHVPDMDVGRIPIYAAAAAVLAQLRHLQFVPTRGALVSALLGSELLR